MIEQPEAQVPNEEAPNTGQPPSLAWVTGASSGMGRALARLMAQRGHTVAVSARRSTLLDDLAHECAALPGRVYPVPLDVTDHVAVLAACETIETTWGPIDLAVLAAGGTGQKARAAAFTADGVRATFDLNVMGTVNVMEAVRDRMMARGMGQIAIIASMAGYRGLPGSASYCASKGALITLAEAWRPEFVRSGIRLQIVNPGFVNDEAGRRRSYPTPFTIDSETAANAIYAGLSSGRFEICFPLPLAVLAKVVRALPYAGYFLLADQVLAVRGRKRKVAPPPHPEALE